MKFMEILKGFFKFPSMDQGLAVLGQFPKKSGQRKLRIRDVVLNINSLDLRLMEVVRTRPCPAYEEPPVIKICSIEDTIVLHSLNKMYLNKKYDTSAVLPVRLGSIINNLNSLELVKVSSKYVKWGANYGQVMGKRCIEIYDGEGTLLKFEIMNRAYLHEREVNRRMC